MARKSSDSERRLHKKEMGLNDQELDQFNLARKASGLNSSEFMRQRCLRITRHKRVSLSQIQIYQRLGVLQQQCEQILKQVEESTRGVRGNEGGGRDKDASAGAVGDGTILAAVEQHLDSIKSLRRQLAGLSEPDINGLGEVIALEETEED